MKKSDRTKEKILNAGLKTWPDITLQRVARAAHMTHPNILNYFPDGGLRDAIAEHAVAVGDSRIIVELMASKHPATEKLSPADRIKHFNAI